MKKWRDARLGPEQRKAVADAMIAARQNRTKAAKLLGVSRMHLYRLLAAGLGDAVTTRDNVTSSDVVTADDQRGSVTRTANESLTYARVNSSLPRVGTAGALVTVPDPTEGTEESVRATMEFPKSLHDWLETEALRRKQLGMLPRLAKSPIVVEALEEYRARREKLSMKSEDPRLVPRRGKDKR